MSNHVGREPKSPTFTDYRLGRHYDWECAVHEHEHSVIDLGGTAMTWEERRDFVLNYTSVSGIAKAESIRNCKVCAPQMVRDRERGIDPLRRRGLINFALNNLVDGSKMALPVSAQALAAV